MTAALSYQSLELNGDQPPSAMPVEKHLENWAGQNEDRLAIVRIITAIISGAPLLATRIAAGSLPGDPARLVGVNSDDDKQKAIDVGSHDFFCKRLKDAGAAIILSEEAELPVAGDAQGKLAVAIDPLDGSGNVGLGAPLGTLFSILPADCPDPFLVAGNRQLAAGYVSYGNSLDLCFSVGEGLILATYDYISGSFLITSTGLQLPEKTSDLAFNASVYHYLTPALQAYVDDCFKGKKGPRGRNFNMRWMGAAVGDLHRVFNRGGLFFYIDDSRPGYENGRLRHVYEVSPMAYLCEQAGGKATNGRQDILSLIPSAHHARCPLVLGSKEEVDLFGDYLAGKVSKS